jgi:hypothetical protein
MRTNSLILTVLLYAFPSFGSEDIPCEYGTQNSCPTVMYCLFVNGPDQALCKKQFPNKLPELFFPFAKDQPLTCWKETDHNQNSSHAWTNARYAVDLHSNKETKNNIYAGLKGKVLATDGCTPKKPECNGAFGNQVKIFSNDGIIIFYAHLSEIYVKTGDLIKAGQLIGKEGATGNVGGMWGEPHDFHHLHFSVHYNWNNFQEEFHKNPWPGIPSIPFKVKVCNPKVSSSCEAISLDIRDLSCTKFDNLAPQVSGFGP